MCTLPGLQHVLPLAILLLFTLLFFPQLQASPCVYYVSLMNISSACIATAWLDKEQQAGLKKKEQDSY